MFKENEAWEDAAEGGGGDAGIGGVSCRECWKEDGSENGIFGLKRLRLRLARRMKQGI